MTTPNTLRPFFEELDFRQTPLGELILQRRRVLALGDLPVYEVKLNDEYLMSSLFHVAEEALAELGLGALQGTDLEIVVGGLGLGYTAAAALKSLSVGRVVVVEALEPVIDWHRAAQVPNGRALCSDSRCELLHADFFALARGHGFAPDQPGYRWDAVLLDIDHTPSHLLNGSHADFYCAEGLRRLKRFIKPGGVFALWSDENPEELFLAQMASVFGAAEGHVVTFANPLTDSTSSNGIYVARNTAADEGLGANQ